jgi:general secretion pathway protein D
MRQVIDQLDVARAQVYVEALMVSVDAQEGGEFGFQWQGLFARARATSPAARTSAPRRQPGNILNSVARRGRAWPPPRRRRPRGRSQARAGHGLNIGFVPKINGIYTLAALAHFLETNTGANVLATTRTSSRSTTRRRRSSSARTSR